LRKLFWIILISVSSFLLFWGKKIATIFICNILSLSGGGRPFHPFVPSSVLSSIHPSSSSRKKKMMEEEEDEWWQQQFIQMFM
jgi:hypothetical protein